MQSNRCRLFACAILAIMPGGTAYGYSNEAVRDAELLLSILTTRRQAGTASSIDVAWARFYLSDMKYEAKRLSRQRYCREVLPLLQEIETRVTEDALMNYKDTVSNLVNFKRQLFKLSALCRKRH
jgi:hypothetical protein